MHETFYPQRYRHTGLWPSKTLHGSVETKSAESFYMVAARAIAMSVTGVTLVVVLTKCCSSMPPF
jgi:hypothetical protein